VEWDRRRDRRIELVMRGWGAVSDDPALRDRALGWLREHPAGWPAVQQLWIAALRGSGELAVWLEAGADPARWTGTAPLHSVLSAHPFACLPRWSNPPTSSAS
jgi:hypothetical protein